MSKLLRKPKSDSNDDLNSKFEKFNLKENPFPSEPVVNKESQDRRINGDIYEHQIRSKEYDQFVDNFVTPPLSDPNHIRLGYLIDTSYIGRGNGKSAFLINLQNNINENYSLDISNELNKCFALYVTPDTGGRSKTFPKLLDLIFESILKSGIINASLAMLRLEAIAQIDQDHPIFELDEDQIIKNLNDPKWFHGQKLDLFEIGRIVQENKHIQSLPPEFPLFDYKGGLMPNLVTQKRFKNYYLQLKKGQERLKFVFTHLVRLFRSASFNGAYIFIDDFERIPDFQSARQKKDFALELRTVLYDGIYHNAKIGFFNLLLVLHAGVPRLISDAWGQSGMEHRAPISPHGSSRHIIHFDKLNKEHAILLISKYLKEYRLKEPQNKKDISPFTEDAVAKIGELSEYNAASILKLSYDLLDKAANTDGVQKIDISFINSHSEHDEIASKEAENTIDKIESANLIDKALNKEDDN